MLLYNLWTKELRTSYKYVKSHKNIMRKEFFFKKNQRNVLILNEFKN